MRVTIITYFLLILNGFCVDEFGRYRTWTSADGRELEGVYYGTSGGKAELFLKRTKKTIQVPLSSLSDEDQAFLKENGWPLYKKRWMGFDDSIVLGKLAVSYSPGKKQGTYESDHFMVESTLELKGAEYQEIFRQLEAFYKLMNSSPWGIAVASDKNKFVIKVAMSDVEYSRNGGPANSAGVYMPDKKLVMTKMESLYRQQRGRDGYAENVLSLDVLSHELAHLLMHDIVGITPPWFVEGVAEYIECFSIRLGKVEVDKLDEKARAARAFSPSRRRLDDVYLLPLAYWQAGLTLPIKDPYGEYDRSLHQRLKGRSNQRGVGEFYQHGLCLVYGLFSDEKYCGATRIMRYLSARKADAAKRQKVLDAYNAKVPAYNKKLEAYRIKFDEFTALPEVEAVVDPETEQTSYRYPDTLTPPEAPPQLERISNKDLMLNKFGHLGLLYSPDMTQSEFLDHIQKLLLAKAQ